MPLLFTGMKPFPPLMIKQMAKILGKSAHDISKMIEDNFTGPLEEYEVILVVDGEGDIAVFENMIDMWQDTGFDPDQGDTDCTYYRAKLIRDSNPMTNKEAVALFKQQYISENSPGDYEDLIS